MKKSVILLLHIGYWFIYLLLVSFIVLAMPHMRGHESFLWLGRILFCHPIGLSAIIPAMVSFYVFYLLLFGKYLQPRKITALVCSGLLTALIAGVITDVFLAAMFGSKILLNTGAESLIGITIVTGFIGLMNGITGLGVKGFIQWFEDMKLREELMKKNFETELALVKSQISPHFLFNTLNNIDVLIQKNPAAASEYLNKLSEIMRFMLYETKPERIALGKELSYITKYIELQKIRSFNPGYVVCRIDGDTSTHSIAPMLYIPFIENAFKHTGNKNADGTINISFTIADDKITFNCSNVYSKNPTGAPDHSGLGNDLIKKRLQLLYPGRHILTTRDEHNTYNVNLVINV